MPQAGGRQTDKTMQGKQKQWLVVQHVYRSQRAEWNHRASPSNPRPQNWPPPSHSNALNIDQDIFVLVLPLESLAEKHFMRKQKHNVLLFF